MERNYIVKDEVQNKIPNASPYLSVLSIPISISSYVYLLIGSSVSKSLDSGF